MELLDGLDLYPLERERSVFLIEQSRRGLPGTYQRIAPALW
jgi:hypothetical protein